MNIKEYQKMAAGIEQEIVSNYEKTIELFENGEKAFNKYPEGYLKSHSITEDLLDCLDYDEILKVIKEHKVNIKELGTHIERGRPHSIDYSADEDEVSEFSLNYSYYQPLSQEQVDRKIEETIRRKVGLLLKPDGANVWTETVGCKNLELFIKGKIDWEVLRDLTYSNHCSI